MKKRPSEIFKTSDLDLITYLRFKGFKSLSNPVEDASGTRWVVFDKTSQLEEAVLLFFSGCVESSLLHEFRKSRSFLLDTPTTREREGEYDNDRRYT